MEPLLKIATDRFGDLTAAEVKLLGSVNDGVPADCAGPAPEHNDPNQASHWDQDRTIRSSIIRWLCTDKNVVSLINSAGLCAAYARLVGELNLVGVSVPFSFTLLKCAVLDGINLQDANLRNLNLSGTVCSYLIGEQLTVNGSLFLREGFKSTGPVILVRSTINGDF